jgi:thymidine kinase
MQELTVEELANVRMCVTVATAATAVSHKPELAQVWFSEVRSREQDFVLREVSELERHMLRRKKGFIVALQGCMYAGKTTSMINSARMLSDHGYRVMTVKHVWDDRYTGKNAIVTHDGRALEGAVQTSKIRDAMAAAIAGGFEVVCVDEAHFFSDGLMECCQDMANRGIGVIMACLDGDFQGKPFPPTSNIGSACDFYFKLSALCERCFEDRGIYTWRLNQENQAQYSVGGKEQYRAVCRGCRHELEHNGGSWPISTPSTPTDPVCEPGDEQGSGN